MATTIRTNAQRVPNAVPQAERLKGVDVVRGAALFGVLFVNLQRTSGVWGRPTAGIERWIENGTNFFIYGSGYSVFAMLFGVGFAAQMTKGTTSSVTFTYLRRVLILFGIGLLHYVFIWDGDILQTYAIVALLLWLVRPTTPKSSLTLAIISLTVVLFYAPVERAVLDVRTRVVSTDSTPDQDRSSFARAAYREALKNGSYLDIVSERIKRLQRRYEGHSWYASRGTAFVLAMFALGIWAWSSGLMHGQRTDLLRRLILFGAALGIIGNAGIVASAELDKIGGEMPLPSFVMALCEHIGNPALGVAYGGGIILLMNDPRCQRLLDPIGAVGRMALTNYLLQSVLFTSLFYGYGLGVAGKLTYLQAALITLAIYALQIPLSVFWLTRFQYGPAEYGWRRLTYGGSRLKEARSNLR